MTRLGRYLTAKIAFLLLGCGVAVVLYPAMRTAFLANPALNGVIVGVLVLGIVYTFRQTLSLNREIDWIETVRAERPPMAQQSPPRLLAPLARMLGDHKERPLAISSLAMRSLLDGVAARLEESRELSRYLIGLLIFLGLLGTFWGLLQTVTSVGEVVGNLDVGGASEVDEVFTDLRRGLEAPLSGMGTAFSSSLFGLAGSLVLGFLDLQAGQAQNRFFNDLEDWLASIARLGTAGPIGDAGAPLAAGDEAQARVSPYLQALVAQTAESVAELRVTVAQQEESRTQNANSMAHLIDRMGGLIEALEAQRILITRIAEGQDATVRLLRQVDEAVQGGMVGVDPATRQHVRNLDVFLQRILEEMAAGRAQSVTEIRHEIKLLARTIAAIADSAEEG